MTLNRFNVSSYERINSKPVLGFIDWLSSNTLRNPYLYTYLRYILIQDQKGMKKFMKKYVDKYDCKSIVDICCGTGDFAMLTPVNGEYIGWDLNGDYISFARKKYKADRNKLFLEADVINSKLLEGKKFDCVLLVSTMHHFSDDEMEKILTRIQGMVKKVVIIADIIPNPPHLVQKFFTKIDRGKFVRPAEEKLSILNKYFDVEEAKLISSGSVVQFCIICRRKKNA